MEIFITVRKLSLSVIFLLSLITQAFAADINVIGFEDGEGRECSNGGFSGTAFGDSVVHGGAYSMRISSAFPGSCSIRNINASGQPATFNAATTYGRFYFRPATLPATTDVTIGVLSDTSFSDKFRLKVTSTGALKFCDSAGSCGSASATTLSTSAFSMIQFQSTTSASASAYQILINGSVALSGNATQSSGNGGNFQFGKIDGSETVDFRFDDVKISDSALPPDGFVKAIKGISNTGTFQWTGSYTDTNQIPTDGDTTFISSSTANQAAYVNLTSTTTAGISGTINGVKGWASTRDVGGTSDVRLRMTISGTATENNGIASGTSFVDTFRYVTSDPLDASALTTGKVDAMTAGVRTTLATAIRCSAIIVFVDYSPAVPTPTPTATNTPTNTPTPTPTPTPGAVGTVPCKPAWRSQYVEWSQYEYDYLNSLNNWTNYTDANANAMTDAHYYDASRHNLIMNPLLGTPEIAATRVPVFRRSYRDSYVVPNGGAANGYTVFTGGLRRDYELYGNTSSRDAIYLLTRNAALNPDTTPLAWTTDFTSTRENAYRIMGELDCRATSCGPNRSILDAWLDQARSHLDQMTVTQSSAYVQTFMVALAAKALIQAYEEYPSYPSRSAIPTIVASAYNWIWANSWVPYSAGNPISQAFKYSNVPIPPGNSASDTDPAPDLNGLIVPPYGWLYKVTGNAAWRTKGDDVFCGSIAVYTGSAYTRGPFFGNRDALGAQGRKQFNQTYQWSHKYIEWGEANLQILFGKKGNFALQGVG